MKVPNFTALGSGPVVLMLHGVGGSHLSFAPQVETLAASGWRAVAWDMPGYGHSAPIEPYTFKGLAESCLTLMDSLQVTPLVLVGHSMGGMVAQEVVARRPDRVRALVLCGTTPSFGRRADGTVSESWQQQFISQRTGPLDAGQTMADVAQRLVPTMIGPAALPEGIQLAMHCMAGVNPSTYRRALAALLTFDRREALKRIAMPALLVAGEFDKAAPPAAMKAMAAEIAGSQYQELAGIGHLMNMEAPEAFDMLLLSFLAGLPG